MSTLTELRGKLSARVPAENGVPTNDQYDQAIKDAVFDLGRLVPRRQLTTISVTSGTADYALPAGFQRIIDFESLDGGGVLWDSNGYLIPTRGLCEEVTLSGNMLTLYPTPVYSAERELLYAAGYPYDEDDDTFTGLTEELESLVLLKAEVYAFRILATKAGTGGLDSYQIGDIRVSKKNLRESYLAQAADKDSEFAAKCAALVGPVGRRSRYHKGAYK